MKQRGFTLIEMLVVMAIISLIATMLVPSLGRARRYAKRVSCITNLKAIGIGWVMYMEEYIKDVPPAVSLPLKDDGPEVIHITEVMKDYVNAHEVWRCLSDDVEYFVDKGTSYEYYPGWFISTGSNPEQIRYRLDEHPAKWAVIVDAEAFHPTSNDLEGRQALYHDGHADWFLKNE
ncbi:MAG: type II secretion system protein [Phycisphaerae bacterium]|jgi:prepilin-type N-terminal cleavage/methylation domain-containing protein|nr:type II secretion system protein [Phycisphaerae bacterium]